MFGYFMLGVIFCGLVVFAVDFIKHRKVDPGTPGNYPPTTGGGGDKPDNGKDKPKPV